MIESFGDEATADLYHDRPTRRARHFPPDLRPAVLRKFDVLDAARQLQDVLSPPGNRLEALSGDWAGFHSIRVNAQWRLVFRWADGHAADVRLVDYH